MGVEVLMVFKKENGMWVLVFKGNNWETGLKIADNLRKKGEEVRIN